MAEFPSLNLWTDAYLGDTTHLSTLEHGAYLLLLMAAWRTPSCDLPNDDKMLARYSKLGPQQWQRIKPTILAFFHVDETGRLVNKRLRDERVAAIQRREKAKNAGQAKALKRLNRNDNQEAFEFDPSTPTIPIPIKEKNLKIRAGNGDGRLWKDPVTIKSREERIARFQDSLAEQMLISGIRDRWLVIAAAFDKRDPEHSRALAICKKEAERMGKGWPLDGDEHGEGKTEFTG